MALKNEEKLLVQPFLYWRLTAQCQRGASNPFREVRYLHWSHIGNRTWNLPRLGTNNILATAPTVWLKLNITAVPYIIHKNLLAGNNVWSNWFLMYSFFASDNSGSHYIAQFFRLLIVTLVFNSSYLLLPLVLFRIT